MLSKNCYSCSQICALEAINEIEKSMKTQPHTTFDALKAQWHGHILSCHMMRLFITMIIILVQKHPRTCQGPIEILLCLALWWGMVCNKSSMESQGDIQVHLGMFSKSNTKVVERDIKLHCLDKKLSSWPNWL